MANEIVDDDRGRRVEIVDPPSADDARRLREADVRAALVKGFGMASLPDLSVLDGVIDSLNVVTLNIRSDAAVTTLPRLRSLAVQTYAQDRIDFKVFESLDHLTFYWRPGGASAFDLTRLKSLAIFKYPYSDLSPFTQLAGLRSLGIGSARIEHLAGIGALVALESLDLWDDRRLVDLSALATGGPRLRGLKVSHCRELRDISALAAQSDLEELAFTDCGRIDSLAPLAGLRKLRRLWLYGTTVVDDGDLSVLLELPRLHGTAFANRRHYSHRSEDIEAELERRHGPYVVSPGHAWLGDNA